MQVLVSAGLLRLFTRKRLQILALQPNRDLDHLTALIEAGQLQPVLDGPYRLDQAIEALRRFGAGEHLGKLVIDFGR